MVHILIVEDDPEYAKLYEIALQEHANVTYEWFMVGQQALASLSQAPEAYHAAIVDIHLPDMPGTRVALEARTLQLDLPILFITGIRDQYNIGLIEQQGTYLEKPFRLSDFHDKIFDLVVAAKEYEIKCKERDYNWEALKIANNFSKE